MKVVASETFLPRVHVVPRVVMISAVGRALQHLYADVLQDALPADFAALLRRLDGRSEAPG